MVLLILAGITITYVLGEDGIIAQAKLAAERTRIANYQTVLEMIRAALEPEKALEELTTEEFLNRYEEMAKKEAENGALKGSTITGPQEGMKDKVKVQTKEGDEFEITEEGVEYKGTFKEGEIQETPDLKEADITWEVSETKQTKESVTVKIILKDPSENFTLQYAKKDKNEEPTEEDWKEYKGETLVFTQNGNAFARLVNSLGDPGNHATKYIGNIDKLPPNEFEAQAEATTNSITVKGHTEDQEENEMYSKSKITKYYFKDITGIEDETSIESSEGWIEETANETGDTSHTFLSLTPGKSYTFVMKAVDEAENETISSEVQISTKDIAVEEVTVTPQTAEIKVDGTVKLTATIEPSNATNKQLTWTSDQTGIAQVTVNEDGTATVTGKGVGQANITVTAQDSTKKSATCTVTVKAKKNEIAKQYGIKQTDNKTVTDGTDGAPKITIPRGYTVLEPTKENTVKYADNNNPKIDEGIVIKDDVGNEFVWVPVPNPEEMYGIDSSNQSYYLGKLYDFSSGKASPHNWQVTEDKKIRWTGIYSYREPDILTTYDTETNLKIIDSSLTPSTFKTQLQKEFKAMIDSVKQYNGFYIGRYETGNLKASGVTPVVKKYNNEISNVNWFWQYKNSKKIAQTGSGVTSSMIWGSQWDATMKWFIRCGLTDYVTGSTINGKIKGNYKENEVTYKTSSSSIEYTKARETPQIIPTGGSEQTKVNNIYDMAGNVCDWTIEASGSISRVLRGR